MLHRSFSESDSAGEENSVFITIKKQIKLYWVTTADHGEDWFIFAGSARQARAYQEHYESSVKAMLEPV